ncbi:hypothetical protein [Alteromonas sp. C1M14]|uniref:hypothetical protein n=1 Tax=Alteromonas sp. C1M14 TaxID=2841567 RepID=UPI001C08D6BE|nr:hypothetical protein [Alteromonas sp. C1M14]MBU2979002.1 hypothetical protein [Alteromonas sp. C1M14]
MTTRILHPTIESLLSGEEKRACLMGSIVWPSGIVRFHNGLGTLRHDGENWYGVGELGSISGIKEGDDSTTTLTLQTADASQIEEAVRDDAAGGEVRLYLGALDEHMRLAHVQLMMLGIVNKTPVKYSAPPSISVEVVSLTSRWNHPKRYTKYNAASQRAIYPTDSFFDDVENVAKGPLNSYSGSNAVSSGGAAGNGGDNKRLNHK